MRSLQIAMVMIVAATGIAAAQDVANGEKSFRKCLPCHSIGPDAQNKVGPKQNGLEGRKAGTVDGYSYTDANKNSGITWDHDAFAKYIRAPMQEMPGTRMAFVGIKNDKDIADLWAYLQQFGPEGQKK